MKQIPPNHPSLAGHGLEYKVQVAQAGLISGNGAFSKKCHRLLEETFGVSEAARGRGIGIGQALVQGALAWFAGQGAQRASVVTQVRPALSPPAPLVSQGKERRWRTLDAALLHGPSWP